MLETFIIGSLLAACVAGVWNRMRFFIPSNETQAERRRKGRGDRGGRSLGK